MCHKVSNTPQTPTAPYSKQSFHRGTNTRIHSVPSSNSKITSWKRRSISVVCFSPLGVAGGGVALRASPPRHNCSGILRQCPRSAGPAAPCSTPKIDKPARISHNAITASEQTARTAAPQNQLIDNGLMRQAHIYEKPHSTSGPLLCANSTTLQTHIGAHHGYQEQ